MKKNTNTNANTNTNTNTATNTATNIDTIVNEIDNSIEQLCKAVLKEIKGLLPQNTVDLKKVNIDYEASLAKAKDAFLKNNDTEAFIASVEKAKHDRAAALNVGNLWGAVAKDYEIDKDFLVKAGFKELADKANSNKFNALITGIFNIVKYSHSIKYKLEECKKTYEEIGDRRLCLVFKHGCYGAKKTFNAVKGKEGLNSKVPIIDSLYDLLTK